MFLSFSHRIIISQRRSKQDSIEAWKCYLVLVMVRLLIFGAQLAWCVFLVLSMIY